jgi:hypothetical protein
MNSNFFFAGILLGASIQLQAMQTPQKGYVLPKEVVLKGIFTVTNNTNLDVLVYKGPDFLPWVISKAKTKFEQEFSLISQVPAGNSLVIFNSTIRFNEHPFFNEIFSDKYTQYFVTPLFLYFYYKQEDGEMSVFPGKNTIRISFRQLINSDYLFLETYFGYVMSAYSDNYQNFLIDHNPNNSILNAHIIFDTFPKADISYTNFYSKLLAANRDRLENFIGKNKTNPAISKLVMLQQARHESKAARILNAQRSTIEYIFPLVKHNPKVKALLAANK